MVGTDSEAQTNDSVIEEDGFVLPPSWRGLQQQVIYLAQFGGGIQVIVGVPGAGKTTFARWLSEDQQALPLIMMAIPTGVGAQSIFYDLLQKLGLRPGPAAALGELLVMLRSYVQSLHRDGHRIVVLIDNAHLIPDSELAALMSVIQGGGESGLGLHLILMAEPGLVERIDQLQLIDVVVHDWSMPPFSPTEVAALIDHLASTKTGKQEVSDDPQSIWSQSRGLPGRVFSIMHAPVEPPPLSDPPPVVKEASTSFGRWPIAHVTVLLVLGGVLLWAFWGRSNESEPLVTAVDVGHLLDEASRPPAVTEDDLQRRQGVGSARGALEARREQVAEEREGQGLTAETLAPANEIAGETDMPGEPADSAATVSEEAPAVIAPGIERDGLNLETSGSGEESGTENAAVSDSAASAEVAEMEVEPSSPQAAVPAEANAAPEVEAQSPSPPDHMASVAAAEAQLLRAPGNGYVLQLMASSAVATLFEFVELQPNRDNLLIYRAERDGKLLHILVEGLYADQSAARAAIVNLPPAQRKGGPWPKKMEQVHQDIHAVRRR